MANFESNSWYQVTLQSSDVLSLASTGVANGAGSAFFQITNTTRPAQQWQFFPSANSTYVVRSNLGGAKGYLTTHVGSSDKSAINSGNTVPGLSDYKVADRSMYWSIEPWGDGSFWMQNLANGTGWHLQKETNGLGSMVSDIKPPQTGQAFIFRELGKINNAAYSSVQTPTASPTMRPSQATSTLGAGTATSTPGSSGLSMGAKAGIGAGVGAAVLIALILGAFLLLRRRKRRTMNPAAMEGYAAYSTFEHSPHSENQPTYAVTVNSSDKKDSVDDPAELPTATSHPVPELSAAPAGPSPVELDAGPEGHKPQFLHADHTHRP